MRQPATVQAIAVIHSGVTLQMKVTLDADAVTTLGDPDVQMPAQGTSRSTFTVSGWTRVEL